MRSPFGRHLLLGVETAGRPTRVFAADAETMRSLRDDIDDALRIPAAETPLSAPPRPGARRPA